jgi:hypothetical protein
MHFVPLDPEQRQDLRPGDVVLIQARVVQDKPRRNRDEHVAVELFSKTDQYEVLIRPDLVHSLSVPVVTEPPDDTWLVGPDDLNGDPAIHVYHRHDAAAAEYLAQRINTDVVEPRFPARWQRAGTGEWLSWSDVAERGVFQALTPVAIDPRIPAAWVDPGTQEDLEKLIDDLGAEVGNRPIRFWRCSRPGHTEGTWRGPENRYAPTVEWVGKVAYCQAPGCTENSAPAEAAGES